MKVLGISGSPRKGGNTETVLAAFMKGAEDAGAETKTVRLVDLSYRNCRGCNACCKKGVCVLSDDITPLLEEVLSADVLVLASPIYSMTMTADLKGFIDRGQVLWARKFITKTLKFSDEHVKSHIGVFLSTSGKDIPHVFDAAFPVARAFLHDAGFSYKDNVLFPGMDEKGGAKVWTESSDEAYARGKEIAGRLI